MSRKILIFNAGNAPIITEAIWGLKKTKNWVPDEIHIFTTDKTDLECREAFVTPAGSSVNRLTEVCDALGIPQPRLDLHLASNAQKEPIHLLKEEWETEALNSLYNEVLPPLFVYDQTEVVCLARSALIEMNMLFSYYAISLLRPGTDHWYSVYIKVNNSEKSEEQEQQLQRNRDFWFPKDIQLGDTKLSADQIQIKLKSLDYAATKRNVLEGQLKNPGRIERIFIDVENKTLTIRANTLMPPVRMKANKNNSNLMSAPMNAFILLTLANMYKLRKEPYRKCDNKRELGDAFFAHARHIKEGFPSLKNDDSFEENLATLIYTHLIKLILEHCYKNQKNGSMEKDKLPACILPFTEVEEVLAEYFYTQPANFNQEKKYWWRNVTAFQWKWEKGLMPRASERKNLRLNLIDHDASKNNASKDNDPATAFIRKNFSSSKETIANYIKKNVFCITKAKNEPIGIDRSNLKRCVGSALPKGDWIKQLHWNPQGCIDVAADNIKFSDAEDLKEALENLLADPNTRFNKEKIQDTLKNIDRYIAQPVPAA